jgi:hypothetical protein
LLVLKKEAVNRSVEQAKGWIRRGKFDQARLVYSALNYLSQGDDRFPLPRSVIQQELSGLEFTAYPVIHQHRFGTCTGRLRMNAYALSFVPSGDSEDGLTVPLKQINVAGTGETLRIELNGETYRFRANSPQGASGNKEAFRALYERLMGLIAKAS